MYAKFKHFNPSSISYFICVIEKNHLQCDHCMRRLITQIQIHTDFTSNSKAYLTTDRTSLSKLLSYILLCLLAKASVTCVIVSRYRSWQFPKQVCSLRSNLSPLDPAHFLKHNLVILSISSDVTCWLACAAIFRMTAAFCSGDRLLIAAASIVLYF